MVWLEVRKSGWHEMEKRFFLRPVQKLFPTKVKHDEGKNERKKKEECVGKENETRKVSEKRDGRPKRAATLDSVWKTKNMIDWWGVCCKRFVSCVKNIYLDKTL